MMQWAYVKGLRLLLIILLLGCSSAVSTGAEDSFLSKERRKEIEKTYGHYAVVRIEAAFKLTKQITPLSERQKLDKVNSFVNRVRFVSDQNAWGVEDYWASPVEFLGRDKGDCEDFVITKYFLLRKSGVSEKRLFFTYVKALSLNQAHMVLTYYETPESTPLVLDNLNFKVLPASRRNDLAFVYSFNAKSLYLNRQKALGKIVPGGRDRNKKWAKFLEKFEKEFQ
jgi:predicted transglutaminase-like cysteine proteinase